VTALPQLIPLFPLPNAVLFPRVPLPLHVFEPRYRKMVADALGGHQTIGMVLLQPGFENDYEGRPPVFPVGCAGTIETCEPLPDGRFNITLKGRSRFRILEEHGGEPYRLATVQALADPAGEPGEVAAARREVMEAIGRAADGPAVLVIKPDVPDEVLANALSQTLPFTPLERQSLLDCDSILLRYQRLVEILDFKRLEETYGGGPTVH